MLFSNERILITGSNGFIAHHLIQRLLEENASVFGISRGENKNALLNPSCFYSLDLFKDNLTEAIALIRPTIIFHLASSLNKDMRNLNESIATNVIGTLNLLKSVNPKEIKHFIALGTSEGVFGNVPFKENNPIIPNSAYSLSKAQENLLLEMYYQLMGYPITILKPAVVYGPNQQNKQFLISGMVDSLLANKKFSMSKGEQTRDFIYVKDLINAMIKTIGNKNTLGETINVGSGKEITIKEVVDKIVKIVGCNNNLIDMSLPYRPNEQMRYCLDISKAKQLLNWEPSTDLDQGLKETIEWYKNAKN